MLDLSRCGIGREGAQTLGEVLKAQAVTRQAAGWGRTLRCTTMDPLREGRVTAHLVVGRGSGDVMPGTGGAGGCTPIRRVTLCGNAIGDVGLAALLACLEEEVGLAALDLQNCGITDAGGAAALEALGYNREVVVMDLRGNDVDPAMRRRIRARADGNRAGLGVGGGRGDGWGVGAWEALEWLEIGGGGIWEEVEGGGVGGRGGGFRGETVSSLKRRSLTVPGPRVRRPGSATNLRPKAQPPARIPPSRGSVGDRRPTDGRSSANRKGMGIGARVPWEERVKRQAVATVVSWEDHVRPTDEEMQLMREIINARGSRRSRTSVVDDVGLKSRWSEEDSDDVDHRAVLLENRRAIATPRDSVLSNDRAAHVKSNEAAQSEWVVVEGLEEVERDLTEAVAALVADVNVRVGHPQGPDVLPDPVILHDEVDPPLDPDDWGIAPTIEIGGIGAPASPPSGAVPDSERLLRVLEDTIGNFHAYLDRVQQQDVEPPRHRRRHHRDGQREPESREDVARRVEAERELLRRMRELRVEDLESDDDAGVAGVKSDAAGKENLWAVEGMEMGIEQVEMENEWEVERIRTLGGWDERSVT
ncbi:Centrosomal protein of 78 kDa [Irineochytrium annulatum]|nr:Centrosomal protein of 78 kDa [Irineochytrium annulatum]